MNGYAKLSGGNVYSSVPRKYAEFCEIVCENKANTTADEDDDIDTVPMTGRELADAIQAMIDGETP